MSIEENEDGTFRFEYSLDVVPCSICGSTSVTLFEDGGAKTMNEHRRGKTVGGGKCNRCNNMIISNTVDPVPSMTMLLDIWNSGNLRTIDSNE